jgi:hypothetical protein
MGKPFTYTRLFKPLQIYDARFWVKLENNLLKLEEKLQKNPIEETKFTEYLWHFPLQSKHRVDLHNIIKLIARMSGTKIMWKWGLNETDRPDKLLLIIGENTRVNICIHILNYTIGGIIRYERYLKENESGRSKALGYKTMTTYIGVKVDHRISKILDLMDFPSDVLYDRVRTNRLENYVMGRYKLDYKKYGQLTNLYENAISKTFHPKRMMI